MKAGADNVIIATDDARVEKAAKAFVATVCMTSPNHESGTERLASDWSDVNIWRPHYCKHYKGDEPLIPPAIINQVANNLANSNAPMATLGVEISHVDEVFNPNAVKVVTDKDGYALYFGKITRDFSRIIDAYANNGTAARSRCFVILVFTLTGQELSSIPTSTGNQKFSLERIECLEQLRVLWYGEKIPRRCCCWSAGCGCCWYSEDLEAVRFPASSSWTCLKQQIYLASLMRAFIFRYCQ